MLCRLSSPLVERVFLEANTVNTQLWEVFLVEQRHLQFIGRLWVSGSAFEWCSLFVGELWKYSHLLEAIRDMLVPKLAMLSATSPLQHFFFFDVVRQRFQSCGKKIGC